MFGFLKKKIKESVDDLKKVFHKDSEELKEASEEKAVSEALEEDKTSKFELSLEDANNAFKIESEFPEARAEEDKIVEEEKVPQEIAEIKEELSEKIEAFPQAEEKKEIFEEITFPEAKEEKKKSFFGKLFKKKAFEKDESSVLEAEEETAKEKLKEEEIEDAKISASREESSLKKKGIFSGLFEKRLSESEFEKFFSALEFSLLESNLAYEVIDLVKERMKDILVNSQIQRGKSEEAVLETLKELFSEILKEKSPEEIIDKIKENKAKGETTKILFIGVNGVGKTTSLAKMAYWLKSKGHSVVFAAADTFRAASIEQIEKHASNIGGIKVIKHKYGGDPAAVGFDAVEHAKSKGIDAVLIDSAGRQHTNSNLMEELKKVKRVVKPDFTIFVADALTGNDAVEQAREFGENIGFDMAILGKADVDEKGGAILSVSYVSKKPILFLGVGQGYEDLEAFDKEKLLKKLF